MSDGLRTMFFFGSMRDRDVLEAILGRPLPASSVPVVLKDHAAMKVKDAEYPALKFAPGEMCFGQVMGGLTPTDLARIAFWEDNEYGLATMPVYDLDEQPTDALVYATTVHTVSNEPWDFVAFQKGVPAYLDEVHKWMAEMPSKKEKTDG